MTGARYYGALLEDPRDFMTWKTSFLLSAKENSLDRYYQAEDYWDPLLENHITREDEIKITAMAESAAPPIFLELLSQQEQSKLKTIRKQQLNDRIAAGRRRHLKEVRTRIKDQALNFLKMAISTEIVQKLPPKKSPASLWQELRTLCMPTHVFGMMESVIDFKFDRWMNMDTFVADFETITTPLIDTLLDVNESSNDTLDLTAFKDKVRERIKTTLFAQAFAPHLGKQFQSWSLEEESLTFDPLKARVAQYMIDLPPMADFIPREALAFFKRPAEVEVVEIAPEPKRPRANSVEEIHAVPQPPPPTLLRRHSSDISSSASPRREERDLRQDRRSPDRSFRRSISDYHQEINRQHNVANEATPTNLFTANPFAHPRTFKPLPPKPRPPPPPPLPIPQSKHPMTRAKLKKAQRTAQLVAKYSNGTICEYCHASSHVLSTCFKLQQAIRSGSVKQGFTIPKGLCCEYCRLNKVFKKHPLELCPLLGKDLKNNQVRLDFPLSRKFVHSSQKSKHGH